MLKILIQTALCFVLIPHQSRPADAEFLQIAGEAGYLSEWTLTSTVTQSSLDRPNEYSGNFALAHIGLCSQSSPAAKTGPIQLHFSYARARVSATLTLDGHNCSYSGEGKKVYNGFMACGKAENIPLRLWLN